MVKPAPTRILIVDDEESICFAFHRYFTSRGADVEVAASIREGRDRYRQRRPDVAFLDVRLPDGSGLELLEQLRRDDPQACVIVMTAYGSLETVTRAVAGKAFDYLVKPLDLDRAAELVAQALASQSAMQQHAATSGGPAGDEQAGSDGPRLIGASPPMQEVYKRIGRVAQSDATVLIRGQTGTGKELVARAIHQHSPRAGGPFVAVNCGALPDNLVESELFGYVRGAFTGADTSKPGRFELADRGTLFLDEIGELPLAAQVKLLRFLDEQIIERLGSVASIHLDVRILAATNRDLTQAITQREFREDLFYRLAVVQIELPPLRDRPEDIEPLTRHFLQQSTRDDAPVPPISPEALALLRAHNWPGNVRELRNAVAHATVVAGGSAILPAHLPETVVHGSAGPGGPQGDALVESANALAHLALERGDGSAHAVAVEAVERAVIGRALAESGGNQSEAAGRLGLHRNSVRRKIEEFGLSDAAAGEPGGR